MKRKLIVIGVLTAAALAIWWFMFKRPAMSAAARPGVAPPPPSALEAITTLITSSPSQVVPAVITTAANAINQHLPPVGQGTSNSKPDSFNPNNPSPCERIWKSIPNYEGPDQAGGWCVNPQRDCGPWGVLCAYASATGTALPPIRG